MKVTVTPTSLYHKQIVQRMGPGGWVVLKNTPKDGPKPASVLVVKENQILTLKPEEVK